MREHNMNKSLKAILTFLLNKRYIGAKHFPQEKLFVSRTKYLPRDEQRECERELHNLIQGEYIIQAKKRTGKGTEWHISLNPRKIQEIYEMIT